MKTRYHIMRLVGAMTVPLMLGSCIDEDLSKCGVDYVVEYQMQQATDLQQTLDREFASVQELEVKRLLQTDMQALLHNRAATMDLTFFQEPTGSLHSQQTHAPNAAALSITLYLERGDYRNVALGMTASQDEVGVGATSRYQDMNLLQVATDTVDAHSAALYMGRLLMGSTREERSYIVPLYMQNAIPVLLIDLNNSGAQPIGCYVRRMANGLHCADSTFLFNNSAVVRTHRVSTQTHVSYWSCCFPSVDRPVGGRVTGSPESEGSLWEVDLYVKKADGTYAKNTVYVKEPLQAGHMEVIKLKLNVDGGATAVDAEVGVSVELDWKPGGNYEIEI